jgi:tetratricopeptide (TPR) repeat protein
LAAANPAAYEPNLATALNNLSLRLADAGRRDEGLEAIEEAVTVHRRLAAAHPAAYEPDLAKALNNLSIDLADAGRRDEAEGARQEATELERRHEPPGRIL